MTCRHSSTFNDHVQKMHDHYATHTVCFLRYLSLFSRSDLRNAFRSESEEDIILLLERIYQQCDTSDSNCCFTELLKEGFIWAAKDGKLCVIQKLMCLGKFILLLVNNI